MQLLAQLDLWKLVGGLGIFLFAMFTLEDSVKQIAGRSFKQFIRRYTNGKVKSIFAGTFTTAVLQSSSAVSLLVLTFVGAGIMAMENAIGVILGANLGTTMTAWIVAGVGFNVGIEELALPIVGVGGVILIAFGKSPRYSNIAKLLIALGFLFMGLGYMKESVEGLASGLSFAELPHFGLFTLLLTGIALTAIMQSSSAAIALALTAINAGLLHFEDAAIFVIGANIGSTSTILIGGIRATQIKKRVAMSHLAFNVFTGIIALILLYPMTGLISSISNQIGSDEVINIAIFHTLFNLLGIVIFYPFIGPLSRGLIRLLPDKKTLHTRYIHGLSPLVYDAALSGIKNEIIHLTHNTIAFNAQLVGINDSVTTPEPLSRNTDPLVIYDQLKLLQSEIFKFAAEMQDADLNEAEQMALFQMLHSAREVLNSAKVIKDIAHNLDDFESEDNAFIDEVVSGLKLRLGERYTEILHLITTEDHGFVAERIAFLLNQISDEDRLFIEKNARAIKENRINDKQVSDLFMVNRAMIYSSRLLLNAITEMKFSKHEKELFDRLT